MAKIYVWTYVSWFLPENMLEKLIHVRVDTEIKFSPCFGDVHIKSDETAMAATTWELGMYYTWKDGTVVAVLCEKVIFRDSFKSQRLSFGMIDGWCIYEIWIMNV